jgi:hypothetical protein
LTPDEYVEVANEMYDEEDPEGGCPPYMTIYHAGHSICEEQCDIVEEDVDLTVLSSVFRAFPQLREVAIHFQLTLGEHDWLESYSYFLGLMSTNEKSYEHYVRMVSNAIQSARQSSLSIDTISL